MGSGEVVMVPLDSYSQKEGCSWKGKNKDDPWWGHGGAFLSASNALANFVNVLITCQRASLTRCQENHKVVEQIYW